MSSEKPVVKCAWGQASTTNTAAPATISSSPSTNAPSMNEILESQKRESAKNKQKSNVPPTKKPNTTRPNTQGGIPLPQQYPTTTSPSKQTPPKKAWGSVETPIQSSVVPFEKIQTEQIYSSSSVPMSIKSTQIRGTKTPSPKPPTTTPSRSVWTSTIEKPKKVDLTDIMSEQYIQNLIKD
eukprot:TRINITY_DN1811_c1_g2_i1.p1 TRINITY_DN1811_c1_g2~~TRINITY_DN1811_c1_g2_i1.p1  ORF type:complete len:211 (-),score=65.38 TRINITY_DN1811_c1_g2_i1:8-550(-)